MSREKHRFGPSTPLLSEAKISPKKPPPPPGQPTVRDLASQLQYAMANPRTGYRPKDGVQIALFTEYEKTRKAEEKQRGRRILGMFRFPKSTTGKDVPVRNVVVRRLRKDE